MAKRESKEDRQMEPAQKPTTGYSAFFNKLKLLLRSSKAQMVVFILVFEVIGYILIRTFAASPVVATIQAEQMTPSGVTTSSSGFMTNLTDGGTLTTPYLWTFSPGVNSSAGYFYANGKLLKKVTGPGPYVLRIDSGLLSKGSNKLGGSWDTTTGVHQQFPTAYTEKINNVAGSGFVTTVTNNMTINAPYIWAFDPGMAASNGYFYADGNQLAKIAGTGPYALMMNSTTLSGGAHKLGGSWDTTTGIHQVFPTTYAATYNPGTSTASNYSIINDSTASGGQAAKFGGGVSLSGSVSLSAAGTSFTVSAHGEQCAGAWPQMSVVVDGTSVINSSVTSTSWTNYSANLNLTSGTHTLTIKNTSGGSCVPNLYVDVTNFYGQTSPSPVPTVALSSSPSSVTSGQSSTLTWASTNATSCTASGAWSGPEPTSGTTSTGALNQNSSYTLACTGAGGTATAYVTITVTSSTGTTFESISNFPRPAPASASAAQSAGWRLVPFSTKTGLDSAIANMQGHDYIYYNGTGVLNISNSSSNAYVIHDRNPSSPVVIDLGTAKSVWDSSVVSGNYVQFAYTGSSNYFAFWLYGSSNLHIFGGLLTTGIGGAGMLLQPSETNALHDVLWYDAYLNYIGGSGIAVRGSTPSTNSASAAYNLDIRAEVNRWSMNPSFDPHCDKGTGNHAMILHGDVGAIHDSRFVVYGHDALKPGETSAGKTWPEGAGGSVIEQGNATQANYNNDVMYAKGVNNLMTPTGTNPGSTCKQTGGNVFNMWGHIQLNGNIVGWGEGDNISGSIINSDNGSWFPGSPALIVQHGRHSNSNQYVGASNIAQPYPTTTPGGTPLGIIYQDIQ